MPTIKIVRKVRNIPCGRKNWDGRLVAFVTRSGGRKLERWKEGMEEKSVSANTVFFPSVSTSIVTCTGSVGTRVAFTHVARLLRDPLILPRKDASLRYRCVL